MTDVAVVSPALDEEDNVTSVVRGFLDQGARVVVVDNASRDRTGERARAAGALVVRELRRGYGAACLAGIEALRAAPPDVVAFSDCDGTADATELTSLVAPIVEDRADLALGRRAHIEPGAMPLHQRAGNAAAAVALRLVHGARVRDVPPYRALRWSTLERLGLREPTYGFPIETIVMASRVGARIVEVDTRYLRRHAGRSKVGGSLPGAARAAIVMGARTVSLRWRAP